MNMLIDTAIRLRIAEIIALARANPFDVLEMLARANHDIGGLMKLMQNYTMDIPVGYRVIYSQEQQPLVGLCHHISISLDRPGLISDYAVLLLCQEFHILAANEDLAALRHKLLRFWPEPLDHNRNALNFIFKAAEVTYLH